MLYLIGAVTNETAVDLGVLQFRKVALVALDGLSASGQQRHERGLAGRRLPSPPPKKNSLKLKS